MLSAEALLSVSGIFPKDPLTRQQGIEAEDVPREQAVLIGEFLDSKGFKKFRLPPRVDHEKTYNALVRGVDPVQIAAVTAELQDGDLKREYEALLMNAREYLRARWPMLVVDVPLGQRFYTPGSTECARASALYAVVNNPRRILAEIAMGTIVAEQVEAFDTLFPDLSKLLRAQLGAELVSRATPRGPAEIPWRIESVLRIVLGLPPEAKIKPAEAAPPAVLKSKVSINFASTRTKADAIVARDSGAA